MKAELHQIDNEDPEISPQRPPVPLRPCPPPPPSIVATSISHKQTTMIPETSSILVSSATHGSQLDMLRERLEVYRAAQSNANAAGEIAKMRRLDRGLKTLETMIKKAKAGNSINEEDIPPQVAVGGLRPTEAESSPMPAVNSIEERFEPDRPVLQPTLPPPLPPRIRRAPSPPSAQPLTINAPAPQVIEQKSPPKENTVNLANQETMKLLLTRRNEYRKAALAAKKDNDRETTLHYVKIAKLFDAVISAMEAGEQVDLSDMPPSPPTRLVSSGAIENNPEEHQPIIESADGENRGAFLDHVVTNNADSFDVTLRPRDPQIGEQTLMHMGTWSQCDVKTVSVVRVDDSSVVFNAPPPPTSVLDSLQQRSQKYKSATEEAQSSDNASKARRMGRIVKQYEDAIKAYKAGKPIDFDELPTPPGFAPIPVDAGQSSIPPPRPAEVSQLSRPSEPSQSSQSASNRVLPSSPAPVSDSSPNKTVTTLPTRSGSLQKSPQALHEKQHAALVERRDLFKVAALEAKRRGDIQAAKEYLKLAKGFEPMIKASLCGLPVNMDSVPLPPQKSQEATFELVSHEDCEPVGDRDELYDKLDIELIAQIEMCANNRSHFSKIGDVQSKKKFETLLLNTKKDLDFVRHANKGGYPVPRFHYETKTFSIVRCFTDLGDDDIELSVIKGINYSSPNPNDVDTYVRWEFPYPETPQKDKTHVVRNTNNPEYNAVFKLAMNRKSRNFTRVVKRQAVKFEVWTKGGFLRSDSLLGTAIVKLAPLETRCAIHDSFDLMEGRKAIGGKLEVQVRIRDPILNKQVETLCEKWLVVSGGHATQI